MNLRSIAGLVILMSAAAVAQEKPADVVLLNGTIHDGTGRPGFTGHVAIRDGRITLVQSGEEPTGLWVIDCTGQVIAPGFIDLHTHSDSQVVSSQTRGCVNYLLQGCTTSVTGNCGGGPTDVAAYYRDIDAAGAGTNVAHLLPQGALRNRVIGDIERKATPEELEQMKSIAEAAMKNGAWGMSTGLIYVPSVYADTEEIAEIAKVIAKGGGIYASHIRGEGRTLMAAIEEAINIGQKASLPVHISHFKSSGKENWGNLRAAAERIEQARSAGHVVTADQYPYTASSTSLEATLFPTWARSGGQKALVERLDDPNVRPRLLKDVQDDLDKCDQGAGIFIARYSPKPEWIGKSVQQIAETTGKTSLAVAEEITRGGGAAVVNFSMSEDDVQMAMQRSWVATASDGRSYLPGPDRPHPRSYGTFPRKIGHYSIREGVLPLEQAIRSASGLPAEILGLTDRGTLAAGQAADVVVFDPKAFIDQATFDAPHQYSAGARYVFVNGVAAVAEGVPTGALAGRALRKSQAPKAE